MLCRHLKVYLKVKGILVKILCRVYHGCCHSVSCNCKMAQQEPLGPGVLGSV